MCKKMSILLSIAAILLAGVTSLSAADAPAFTAQNNSGAQNTKTGQATAQGQQNERAFLGVAYRPIPKAIESQLSAAFPDLAHGAGVLIMNVMPKSPAAKAGIKPYDLVTSVNNKAIKSADDLMKIVEREKPGQQVSMQIVRASKAEDLKVTLGERPNSAVIRGQAPAENSARSGQESANNQETANNRQSAQKEEVELESFDALSLERTGKDQYKAEIKFRDKQGKIDSRTFQGTREQIRKDVMSQKDLPKSEQHQLLGSLRLPVELQMVPATNGSNSSQERDNGT